MYLRKKRAVQRTEKDAVKRRLRLQQQELKDTVTRLKMPVVVLNIMDKLVVPH